MHLDHYIETLLYRYECVILPGFGAFLTQYHPARLHETTNAFYPPKKQLSFNGQLMENDGLLANYIAKTASISHEEANQQIASYVRFLFDTLHSGAQATLENIGVCTLGEEHQIIFEPSMHLNYLTSAFGLSAFTLPQIKREVYKEEVTQLEEKAPIAFTPERRSQRKWLNYAAVGLIAVLLSGYAGNQYLQQVETHNFAAQKMANEQVETKIQEATFVIENPLPAIKLAFTQPKGKYHVVAGAFSFAENAQKKVIQLKAKGYEQAYIMGLNSYGLHQVVYGSYTSSQEALSLVRTVRRNDNPDAWIDIQDQ